MLLSFPYTINNSEEMLVLSGYVVRADKAKGRSGPEQTKVAPSELFHQRAFRKTGKERGRGWPMSEIQCWFLSSALQGSWLHAGHLLAAFQNNQKEVQSCRGKGLEAVTVPPICFFSTIFA